MSIGRYQCYALMRCQDEEKTMSSDRKTSTRQKILEVADDLFYREGIQAVGVDTIIAQSGVAKTTLYRYFPSKDDLVVAYLEERQNSFKRLFEIAIARYPNEPKQQIIALFAWLDKYLTKPECYGCPFLVTASELPELEHPAHQLAVSNRIAIRDRLVSLAEAVGVDNPQQLGVHLLLLIDGAFTQRRLFGIEGFDVRLKPIVAQLVDGNG
ncbi:TetR/AcrR family transcriptional regulator [Cyanosarcina cf. burmensis CCALA 770]|nr:TetR/AcrR family transcriptional regulator [Cyanosarcina cf. burmensis CCALA 770]